MLLDVMTAGPQWQRWITETLLACVRARPVAINPLIFGEVAFACYQIEC
ncbi:hypothetical protein SynRS9907_02480 [Synechococcus sp. RS9907]|nr:hypothetical protein SynRS9907_02480 [Synechococcus sp. RS9907]